MRSALAISISLLLLSPSTLAIPHQRRMVPDTVVAPTESIATSSYKNAVSFPNNHDFQIHDPESLQPGRIDANAPPSIGHGPNPSPEATAGVSVYQRVMDVVRAGGVKATQGVQAMLDFFVGVRQRAWEAEREAIAVADRNFEAGQQEALTRFIAKQEKERLEFIDTARPTMDPSEVTAFDKEQEAAKTKFLLEQQNDLKRHQLEQQGRNSRNDEDLTFTKDWTAMLSQRIGTGGPPRLADPHESPA